MMLLRSGSSDRQAAIAVRCSDQAEQSGLRLQMIGIVDQFGTFIKEDGFSFVQGSWFSSFKGTALLSLPRPLRRGWSSRLELGVGEPVQPHVTPENLQEIVLSLRGNWK